MQSTIPRSLWFDIKPSHMLPYGLWTCEDGRQVLFNRQYQPILTRELRGDTVVLAHPLWWVSWAEQKFFWQVNSHEDPSTVAYARKGSTQFDYVNEEVLGNEWGMPIIPHQAFREEMMMNRHILRRQNHLTQGGLLTSRLDDVRISDHPFVPWGWHFKYGSPLFRNDTTKAKVVQL